MNGRNAIQHEIAQMTETFEAHSQETENGIEYWQARDFQHLLGYAEWHNFLNIVGKARTACELVGHEVQDHFVDITKMAELGSGSRREIPDIRLPRYACYLVAQNGDPALLSRGIRPESLPPEEDVTKVERRLASEQKKALNNPTGLEQE